MKVLHWFTGLLIIWCVCMMVLYFAIGDIGIGVVFFLLTVANACTFAWQSDMLR